MKQSITELYESTLKLVQVLSPAETYATIVKEAQKLADASYGSIFLEKKGKLERVYSSVPLKYQFEPNENGHTYQCLRQRKTLVVPIVKIRKNHPELGSTPATKMILIPLAFETQTLGVLSLDSKNGEALSGAQLQTLKLFGSLASLKLNNNSLIAELEASIATRDLFISMASHELKTPLTTLAAYAQLVERGITDHKEIKVEWASILRSSSLRLSRLVNELLNINQIRSGKMTYDFSQQDVYNVIVQAINDFTLSNPRQAIELRDRRKKDEESKVYGDFDKLVQVVINILNNAAKFSPSEKSIIITLSRKGKKIVITVKDQGPGIAEADLSHLFQEFYKAKGNSKEGLGLGLFISQKIIQAHKGKIQIRSELGTGTEVKITLPSVAR